MCDWRATVNDSINILLTEKSWKPENDDVVCENLRVLRNSCCNGAMNQLQIVQNKQLLDFLEQILFPKSGNNDSTEMMLPKLVRLIAGQLMANTIVNNAQSRDLLWQRFGSQILDYCINSSQPETLAKNNEFDCNLNIFLMVLYNVHTAKPIPARFSSFMDYSTPSMILRAIVSVWRVILIKQSRFLVDYLHFLFEVFLERLAFLDYAKRYLDHGSPNGLMNLALLDHFSNEFKLKSDSILHLNKLQDIEKMHAQETYSLLKILATLTGSDRYSSHYSTDHSLFLNISSMLRCLVKLGKTDNGIYRPLGKLEEVAPCSSFPRDYEVELTFELKTLLIRCTANLLHQNPTNKQYCIETGLMPALLECTNMDARNPMAREWSILAIRNACEECKDIQNIIANLTKLPCSDVLNELNNKMGSLHIKP